VSEEHLVNIAAMYEKGPTLHFNKEMHDFKRPLWLVYYFTRGIARLPKTFP